MRSNNCSSILGTMGGPCSCPSSHFAAPLIPTLSALVWGALGRASGDGTQRTDGITDCAQPPLLASARKENQ